VQWRRGPDSPDNGPEHPCPLAIASVAKNKEDGTSARDPADGEDPSEHRPLGYWQSLVDHVEARLDNLRVDVHAKDQGDGGWPMDPLNRKR